MSSPQAVLIADVVDSRSVRDFRTLRDRTLRDLSESHQRTGWTETPYAVTAWDEFQGVIVDPDACPRALWSLRRSFYPLALRIGIGIGAVETGGAPSPGPVNMDATGDAFVRARAALEEVGRRRDPRLEPLTEARTGSERDDRVSNALLHLADLLAARITDGQWRTIAAFERHGRQDRAAAELERDESTVSRALKRASYSHILEAMDSLGIVLATAAHRLDTAAGGRSR